MGATLQNAIVNSHFIFNIRKIKLKLRYQNIHQKIEGSSLHHFLLLENYLRGLETDPDCKLFLALGKFYLYVPCPSHTLANCL